MYIHVCLHLCVYIQCRIYLNVNSSNLWVVELPFFFHFVSLYFKCFFFFSLRNV